MHTETTDFVSGALNALLISLIAWAAFGQVAYGLLG
jgi:hypothetical protein